MMLLMHVGPLSDFSSAGACGNPHVGICRERGDGMLALCPFQPDEGINLQIIEYVYFSLCVL